VSESVWQPGDLKRLLGLTFLGALVGLVLALVLPKKYEAVATVIFPRVSAGLMDIARPAEDESNQAVSTLAISRGRQPTVEYASSILSSRSAARKVSQELDLIKHWEMDDEKDVLREFSDRLQVQKLSRDNKMIIRFRDRDPKIAEKALDGLLREYYDYTREHALTGIKKQRLFLDEQVRLSSEHLASVEKEWTRFKTSAGTKLVRENPAILTDLMAQHTRSASEVDQLNTLLRELQTSKQEVVGELAGSPIFPTDDPLLQRLQSDLTNAQVEEENLLLARTPKHPDVVAAHSRVVNLRQALEKRRLELSAAYATGLSQELIVARSQAEAAEARKKEIDKQLERFTREFSAVPAAEMENLSYRDKYELSRELNRLLQLELSKARIAESLDTVDLEVLDPPEADNKPAFPKKSWFTLGGALAGLGLGCFLLYRRQQLALVEKPLD
jgi:uncharacterized protein involved in exopolysaccharide biosynthesis